MVTIIGNGMGDYDFSNINIDLTKFDKILCDINFIEKDKNILKLKYKDIKEYILNNYDRENILYIVTGSPLFFSSATIIASKIPKDKVTIINNQSSLDYILEYFGISYTQVDFFSLHGRTKIDLTKFLINTYTFILCDDKTIPIIQKALEFIDKSKLEVTIGYKLGYKDEVIEQLNISNQSYKNFDLSKPYILLIKRLFTPLRIISEDGEFETQRGMITKKYKRNLSLQNLDLEPNDILWDIGAGSGSCAIEAYKRYKVKTILFEKLPIRIDFIKENLKNHFVLNTTLLEGEAQDKFETIDENPNKIFVGGGGEKVIEKLPYLYERLEKDGIILINAITLKNLTQMLNILNEANLEYEIFSISLTTFKGKLDLIEPQRQLFSIKLVKN
jgi:precorrin-6Y C5,15-methyltransferase (decarboxylating)